jgi:uncharacterized coiled-coil DUF342 family protein
MRTKKSYSKKKKRSLRGGEPTFQECFQTHIGKHFSNFSSKVAEHLGKGSQQLRDLSKDTNEKMETQINSLKDKLQSEDVSKPALLEPLTRELTKLKTTTKALTNEIDEVAEEQDEISNILKTQGEQLQKSREKTINLDEYIMSPGLSRTRDIKSVSGGKKKSKKKNKKTKKYKKSRKSRKSKKSKK